MALKFKNLTQRNIIIFCANKSSGLENNKIYCLSYVKTDIHVY